MEMSHSRPTTTQLRRTQCSEPTSAEIAKHLDIPAAKVRKVLKIMQVPISLETPIGEEGDSHLGDFIADRAALSPAETVINVNLKERTAHVLHTLTPREEKIMKMRFGLEDGSELGAHAGGGWPRVRRHPRAHSPDRSQGPAQAAPAFTLRQAQVISRRRARMTPQARRARTENPERDGEACCELT